MRFLYKVQAWLNEICHIITRDLERFGNMNHKYEPLFFVLKQYMSGIKINKSEIFNILNNVCFIQNCDVGVAV